MRPKTLVQWRFVLAISIGTAYFSRRALIYNISHGIKDALPAASKSKISHRHIRGSAKGPVNRNQSTSPWPRIWIPVQVSQIMWQCWGIITCIDEIGYPRYRKMLLIMGSERIDGNYRRFIVIDTMKGHSHAKFQVTSVVLWRWS